MVAAVIVTLGLLRDGASPTSRAEASGGRCADIERATLAFIEAVNSGDPSAIRNAVVSRGQFPIYSQGLSYRYDLDRFFSSRSRREIVGFLVERQRRGDRFELESLDPNGYDRAFGICNAGFELWRVIRGGPRRLFLGKGAMNQETGDMAVWNIGSQAQ